jgi:hypothetical protein
MNKADETLQAIFKKMDEHYSRPEVIAAFNYPPKPIETEEQRNKRFLKWFDKSVILLDESKN